MKTLQEMHHCSQCHRATLHVRTDHSCPHLVHALITVFLCGLWIPVWIICTFSAREKNKPAQCTVCGNSLKEVCANENGRGVEFYAKRLHEEAALKKQKQQEAKAQRLVEKQKNEPYWC
jgi:hypothetical protein